MTDLKQVAAQDAKRYGLDPSVFTRQISAESGFNPRISSPAGARGVAQIMPGTARAWGVNPDDPIAALDAAARHMAQYVKQYGSYRNALVAYNAGPGRVGGKLPAETVAYISKILGGKKGPSGTGASGTTYLHGTKVRTYLPTSTQVDTSSAAIDALMAHERDPNQSLLSIFSNNLDSGQYTTQTPAKVGHITVPGVTVSDGGVSQAATGKLPKGITHFEGKPVAAWIAGDLQWAREHGWTGKVNSGFRTLADQTRIYNSGVRPAAKPGTSNHEMTAFPGGAVDVSNAQQLANVLAKKPGGSLLQWAGAKDPVHFSHPHNGSY